MATGILFDIIFAVLGGLALFGWFGFLCWLMYKEHRRTVALQEEQMQYYRDAAAYFRYKS